jgi:DNA (cytosine-5)-methyltransferase 1
MLIGLDLFSGYGGISLGLVEWVRPALYCEIERYPQSILLSRMADGQLARAPIWDDIRTLSGRGWRGAIDIVYGGFPCQDISVAGTGRGLDGDRSGLFFEVMRLAEEIEPTFVFLENVPAIRTRGLERVVGEFSRLGYDCRWRTLSAHAVGAPHFRNRWFLLAAHPDRIKCWHQPLARQQQCASLSSPHGQAQPLADADRSRELSEQAAGRIAADRTGDSSPPLADAAGAGLEVPWRKPEDHSAQWAQWWSTEPAMGGTFDGFASWLDLYKTPVQWMVKRIAVYARCREESPHEILQILRKHNGTKAIQQSPRGYGIISSQKILQSCLQRIQEGWLDEARLQLQSKKISEIEVRSLWINKGPTGASRRSGHNKKCSGEYSDSLQELSSLLALDSQKAWATYRWENDHSVRAWGSGWDLGIDRMTSESKYRVDRIKALGNGVVPAQVREAFRSLMWGQSMKCNQ